MPYEDLPKAEFAFPGPLRDELVAAILSGAKTSTSGLFAEHELGIEPLPKVGQRSVVIDSAEQPVAVIETIEVRVIPVGDCDLQHALDEGEGFKTIAEWRSAHDKFWHSPQMRQHLDDPLFTVTDETLMVAERFKVIERL